MATLTSPLTTIPPLLWHTIWGLLFTSALLSCSKSVFRGEYNSLLFTDPANKTVVLDYTELIPAEPDPELFMYMAGSDLVFAHLYCINNTPESLSKDCIVESGKHFQTDFIVTCHRSGYTAGDAWNVTSDYESRLEDKGLLYPDPQVQAQHTGTVLFHLYDTHSGEKIHTFEVTVRISGVGIKNKRDEGYQTVNLAPGQMALGKARRKGLKNIAKRIRRR